MDLSKAPPPVDDGEPRAAMVSEDGKIENGYFGWGADATDRSEPVPASSSSPVVI
jgi:hypothetical protein